MIKPAQAIFKSLTGLFIIITVLCLIFSNQLDSHKIDHKVLLFANLLLFILMVVTAFLHIKALSSSNPNAFIRSITAGVIIKLFVIAAAVLIYLYTSKENKSVYAVALAMILYMFYTIIEVKSTMRLNSNKNAKS